MKIIVPDTCLYRRYASQDKAQPCYVELDCRSRTLRACHAEEIGATPADVYHGHVRRYAIDTLKSDSAERLLYDLAPLAERVCDGYERVWNGRNHIGRLSRDAASAAHDMRLECERFSGDPDHVLEVWEASEWLGTRSVPDQRSALGIGVDTTDEDLARIAEALTEEARVAGVDILEDLPAHLRWLRDSAGA